MPKNHKIDRMTSNEIAAMAVLAIVGVALFGWLTYELVGLMLDLLR